MKKERYGKITKTTETKVIIEGIPLKTTPEANARMVNEKIIVGDDVIFTYDTKDRNLIDIRHKPKPPSDIIDADAERARKLYMEQPNVGDGYTPVRAVEKDGNGDVHMKQESTGLNDPVRPPVGLIPSGIPANNADKLGVHIQKPKEIPIEPRMWIPDDEKNNFILMQNVLARSVEIVNAHWQQYEKEKSYVDNMDTRLKMIEKVSDRLFRYVKKKVEQERVKK